MEIEKRQRYKRDRNGNRKEIEIEKETKIEKETAKKWKMHRRTDEKNTCDHTSQKRFKKRKA